MHFVELDAARSLDVPVMTVATVLPSPWSEAAKSIFHVKKMDVPLVRFRSTDPEVAKWSGMNNAPVLLCKGEPRRTGWADILMFAERAGGAVSLVPHDAADRIRLFGVAHEIAGEGGLGYSERLVMIHGSLVSDGAEGFPMPAAKYLAPKYGYNEERVAAAKHRVVDVLDLLHRMIEKSRSEGRTYLLGDRLTALDIYLATFLTPIVGVSEKECPGMLSQLRPAFAYLAKEVGHAVTEALKTHRSLIFQRHLVSPIEL
jgi:glutathione S-transferase